MSSVPSLGANQEIVDGTLCYSPQDSWRNTRTVLLLISATGLPKRRQRCYACRQEISILEDSRWTLTAASQNLASARNFEVQRGVSLSPCLSARRADVRHVCSRPCAYVEAAIAPNVTLFQQCSEAKRGQRYVVEFSQYSSGLKTT